MTPPIRSTVLDVPGHSARKLQRGIESSASALMVDLEDSVPAFDDVKRQARRIVADALHGRERDVVLRTNEVDSPWFADDAALAVDLGVAGVVLPKMRTMQELFRANARLDDLRAADDFEIWAIVETPSFLLSIERTADLPPRLSALVAGLVDLTLELNPNAFLTELGLDAPAARTMAAQLRLRILVAARAAGCAAVDALTVAALKDPGLARSEAATARENGFDSVILLHPDQIEPAAQAFTLTSAELDRAEHLAETGARAAAEGRVSAIVDGRVVLPQHVKAAAQVLAARDGGCGDPAGQARGSSRDVADQI